MKKPNLFIVGAPKCGTTSLAAWLAEHENIYMSPIKEPDYFSTDIKQAHRETLKGYEKLFRAVEEHHIVVAEASTSYLRSSCAVPNILEYSPDAKFVVCLRNPVDLAISWHGQMCYAGWESVDDIEMAWRLQERRRLGKDIPRLCPDALNLDYAAVCSLGTQLERLFRWVNRQRVFVILLDDMSIDTVKVYQELLAFLNLQDDKREEFPILNEARSVPRMVSILTRLVVDTKRKFGITKGLGLVKTLNKKTSIQKKSDASGEFKEELKSFFRDEVLVMSDLLDRDLASMWKGVS